MKIIIEGNMASGKSTYAKALAKLLKLPLIGMDAARREIFLHMDVKTKERETLARNYLAGQIKSMDAFVYERIGTGQFDQEMDQHLDGAIRILIRCKPLACILRFENRQANNVTRIPLPDWMDDPETYIRKTHEKLDEKMERHQYLVECENTTSKTVRGFKRELMDLAEMCRSFSKPQTQAS
jgi:adenylate kinase family enzyme